MMVGVFQQPHRIIPC